MEYSSNRSHGCRMMTYTHRGTTFLRVENETLRVCIWLDKGADITELLYKPLDIDFMWKAPVGIVNPALQVQTTTSPLGNNLDYYEGGWHESLPGGGPYTDYGMEQGIHGEVALLPWDWAVACDTEDCVSVDLRCKTVRAPLSVRKRVTLRKGVSALEFEESVENESDAPFSFMWGQHPTFGAPFLGPDCYLDTPATSFAASSTFQTPTGLFEPGYRSAWPLATRPDGTTVDMGAFPPREQKQADMLFLEGFSEGWYALTNRALSLGIGMVWDAKVFSCIWYWKVLGGLGDYPWFSRTYNIGVEFWNGWPNYDTLKAQGKLPSLAPRGKVSTEYRAVVYTGTDRVRRISPQGQVER